MPFPWSDNSPFGPDIGLLNGLPTDMLLKCINFYNEKYGVIEYDFFNVLFIYIIKQILIYKIQTLFFQYWSTKPKPLAYINGQWASTLVLWVGNATTTMKNITVSQHLIPHKVIKSYLVAIVTRLLRPAPFFASCTPNIIISPKCPSVIKTFFFLLFLLILHTSCA